MAGAAGPEEDVVIRSFLLGFEVLDLDENVAEAAVRIRRDRPMKPPDAFILATAIVHDLPLATRNTRDFSPEDPRVVIPYPHPTRP